MSLATSPLYASGPRIDLDASQSTELTQRVLSLLVTETIEGLSRCELVVGNWGGDAAHGFVFTGRETVDFGKQIEVRLGDGDRSGRVFAGRITGIEAHYPELRAPEVVLLAEDGLQDLRMTRRTRSFEDASDEDVIRDVVSEHGLTAEIDVDGPTHAHVAQLNQSDLAFVRDRARLVDADVWIDGSTVHVAGRDRASGEEVTLAHNADLREVSILADLAHQRSAVVVAGWDVAAKEVIDARADASAISSELDGDRSGIELLEQAFSPRTETIVHTAPSSSDVAQAQADMALRTSARRFVTAVGRAEGDARLRPGGRVRLTGLGPGFNGRYTLVEVEHTFDLHVGYQTRFRAERPGLGPS